MTEPVRIEVQIGPLRLAVLGWAYPEAQIDWDADRLLVNAVCVGNRSRVEASGDIVPALSFRQFGAALKQMHATLSGEARLETHDPDLKVVLKMSDGLGHIRGLIVCTPVQSRHVTERNNRVTPRYLEFLIAVIHERQLWVGSGS